MATSICNYKLENLWKDQDPALFVGLLAPLIAWVYQTGSSSGPHSFIIDNEDTNSSFQLNLEWDLNILSSLVPNIQKEISNIQLHRSPFTEKQTEYAAYGLAFIAASCILNKKICYYNYLSAPDLLFNDLTCLPHYGIEVAGRVGGKGALINVLEGPYKKGKKYTPGTKKRDKKKGKRYCLTSDKNIAEAYVSLWTNNPAYGYWERIKP